jgi:predicted MPP superfamily phosphohydrolase
MSTHWNKDDEIRLLDLIKAGFTINQSAHNLRRSYRSVERKLFKLRQAKKESEILPKPTSEIVNSLVEGGKFPEASDDPNRLVYWRNRAKSLEREVVNLEKIKTAQEIIAEEFLNHAPAAYEPPSFKKPEHRLTKKHGSPQSAVLLFSDSHIGAIVREDQTLNLGKYDFEIFLRRLYRLERSIFSILRDHTATEIPEIVIPMIGDMLDGALVHAAECGQANTILSQFYAGGHAIAQFFRNLSTIAPLRIYGVVGNHTRWGHQHKMPSKNRNSNFDMLLYLYAQALTRDIERIDWKLDTQPFATFEVQGFQFYAAHGDNIRGGDKTLGLPAHSMGRMISTTNQLFTRAQRPSPDYFLLGHLHRPIEIPHAKGAVIVNGAFPGIDGYAMTEYFNSSHPIQKFWLMHPKFGRSATYDLRLDLGDDEPHGFQIPQDFVCV